jgi:rhodanese-related sulfurtransferase
MKHLALTLLLSLLALPALVLPALAEVTHRPASAELINSGIPVIDIRTEQEWRQTGVVAGAIPITFFDARGRYDAQAFLQQLEQQVDKDQPIALICRTGNRTRAVSQFLSEQGYQVINMEGGIMKMLREGYQPVSYNQRVAELNATDSCTPGPMGC